VVDQQVDMSLWCRGEGMEQPPDQDPLIFHFNDAAFEANPHNTMGFIHQHEEDSMFDHIFMFTNDDPEVPEKGYYAWRNGIEDFDEVIETMREYGFTILEQNKVAPHDREAYFMSHSAELKTVTPTLRQERRIQYLSYILEHNVLTVEDFLREGELFI
jgi:hypothetical protein